MAIPLIIGAGLGVAGLYKTGKAVVDNSDANDINDSARDISRKAQNKLDDSKEHCETQLKALGACKANAYRVNIKKFIDTFGQIKNVEFDSIEMGNLSAQEFDVALTEMREGVSFVLESGLGAGGGALAGALTTFGAYNGTMALAAASTGTAISSLSGAAATNATLAWLGGGSLASGGMGIAGGTMALGALAAGPALLVAGWYMGSKAESKLNDARSNKAEAEKFAEDCKAARALTDGIANVASISTQTLSLLRKYARRSLRKLENLITTSGIDYTQYTDDEKDLVLRNVKIMQVMKTVIDTPILDQEGNLLGDAEANLNALHQEVQSQFAPVQQS